MKKINQITNFSFLEFNRYKEEIYFNIYEKVIHSNIAIAKETVAHLGVNELHYMVKYHIKIILNTLFFKDQNILLTYYKWLYKYYFYKGINLDFFIYFNKLIQNISDKYISNKATIILNQYIVFVLEEHDNLKEKAPKKNIYTPNEELVDQLVETLITGNHDNALQIIENYSSSLESFLIFYEDIISDVMKEIGFLWQTGEISVAKEHIATNTLDNVLTKIIDKFPKKEPNNIHIFLSSAPNELHGLGLSIASHILQQKGYKVTNVGTNIPTKEIQKAIFEFQPNYIIFTATLQTSLLDIAVLIDDIILDKSSYVKPFQIAIAGGAFENITAPAKKLKADFYANSINRLLETIQ